MDAAVRHNLARMCWSLGGWGGVGEIQTSPTVVARNSLTLGFENSRMHWGPGAPASFLVVPGPVANSQERKWAMKAVEVTHWRSPGFVLTRLLIVFLWLFPKHDVDKHGAEEESQTAGEPLDA